MDPLAAQRSAHLNAVVPPVRWEHAIRGAVVAAVREVMMACSSPLVDHVFFVVLRRRDLRLVC